MTFNGLIASPPVLVSASNKPAILNCPFSNCVVLDAGRYAAKATCCVAPVVVAGATSTPVRLGCPKNVIERDVCGFNIHGPSVWTVPVIAPENDVCPPKLGFPETVPLIAGEFKIPTLHVCCPLQVCV